MISLRPLDHKDKQFILEWMKDPAINQFFRFDANKIDEQYVDHFIDHSFSDTDRHYAIVNEQDEYQGTISLKNIDPVTKSSEYAISTRKSAHGRGIALEATHRILEIGFNELKLHRIYLNVLTENERANNFYKKFGFIFEGTFVDAIVIRGQFKTLNWYRLLDSEYAELIKNS